MVSVTFHEQSQVDDALFKLAVIVARHGNHWIFCRHKQRKTWEIPGGHREQCEDVMQAARRELFEETGAVESEITPISAYCVRTDATSSFGMLFYADVKCFGELPTETEMAEITLSNELPTDLTYPLIQPHLFKEAISMLGET